MGDSHECTASMLDPYQMEDLAHFSHFLVWTIALPRFLQSHTFNLCCPLLFESLADEEECFLSSEK